MLGVEGLSETLRGNDPELVRKEMQASRQSNTRPVRRSLQRKLLWWVVALVVCSTVVSTYWLNDIPSSAMRKSHARNAVIISQTLAGSLSQRMGRDERHMAVNLISRMEPVPSVDESH